MGRSITQIPACLFVVILSSLASGADLQLQEGTPVLLKLNQPLSSASKLGTKVGFTTLEDVKLNDRVVIKRGAAAWGIVNDLKAIQKWEENGRIGVRLENVEMANGAKAPIREDTSHVREPGAAGSIVGGVGSTSKKIGRISTAGLLFKGKGKVTVPADTEVRAVIQGVVLVDPADFPAAEPQQSAAVPKAPAAAADAKSRKLTNADVLFLKEQGFSDDLLVAKIKASPCEFKTDPEDLLGLKKAGVSDALIRAMIEAAK